MQKVGFWRAREQPAGPLKTRWPCTVLWNGILWDHDSNSQGFQCEDGAMGFQNGNQENRWQRVGGESLVPSPLLPVFCIWCFPLIIPVSDNSAQTCPGIFGTKNLGFVPTRREDWLLAVGPLRLPSLNIFNLQSLLRPPSELPPAT